MAVRPPSSLCILFFVTVLTSHISSINSLTTYAGTAALFNAVRTSVKNISNLKELGQDPIVKLALIEYLQNCDGLAVMKNGLPVDRKFYFLNAVFTNEKKFNIAKNLIKLAGTGSEIINKTSVTCPMPDPYCKAYYMLMNSRATVADCGRNYCPHKIKGRDYYYIYACVVGPKVGSYTDPKYPAYKYGPPCSHCDKGEICRDNLCGLPSSTRSLSSTGASTSGAVTSGSKSSTATASSTVKASDSSSGNNSSIAKPAATSAGGSNSSTTASKTSKTSAGGSKSSATSSKTSKTSATSSSKSKGSSSASTKSSTHKKSASHSSKSHKSSNSSASSATKGHSPPEHSHDGKSVASKCLISNILLMCICMWKFLNAFSIFISEI